MTQENTHQPSTDLAPGANSRSSSSAAGEPAESAPLSLAARAASLLKRIGMKELWGEEELSSIVFELDRAAAGIVTPDSFQVADGRFRHSPIHGPFRRRGGAELAAHMLLAQPAPLYNGFEHGGVRIEPVVQIELAGPTPPESGIVTDKESRLARDLDADGETEGEESR